MTIWVDSWQMQCCGEPFRRGSQVAWALGDADVDWLEAILGAGAARAVDAAEEHHGAVPGGIGSVQGRVTRITAVHCRYEPGPGTDSRVLFPVPGSSVMTEVESADGWAADRGDERFVGYLVQVEPLRDR